MLAYKYVPHSFWKMKEALGVLDLLPTDHLSSSRDWYEPPLKGISLGRVLARLGAVCTVHLPTSPIITARREPLTEDDVFPRLLYSTFMYSQAYCQYSQTFCRRYQLLPGLSSALAGMLLVLLDAARLGIGALSCFQASRWFPQMFRWLSPDLLYPPRIFAMAPKCPWRLLHRITNLSMFTILGFWSNNSEILPEAPSDKNTFH
jgi:hypothetical protein